MTHVSSPRASEADPASPVHASLVQVVVVFAALTAAAVALTLIAAYWHNDGAEALGYLGGGMFGGALSYLLLQSSRYPSTRAPR